MAHNAFTTDGKGRFTALDVLRGLTLAGMLVVNNPGSWSHVYAPLLHADFNGLTPTDLVFPFFMFIMGYSMFLSLKKFEAGADRGGAVRKVVDRTLKIFFLGLAINCLSMTVFRGFDIGQLRILGVLQRLALSYGAAALIVLYVRNLWALLCGVVAVLVGYGCLLAFGNGYALDPSNIVAIVDRAVLGEGHMYKGDGLPFDPEGLLSTLPCVCHVILGYVVAKLTSALPRSSRSLRLIAIGAALAAVAVACDQCGVFFNKKIWSPSFVLVTCGLGSMLLGCADFLLRGNAMERLTMPFKVMGMNCIAVFFISDMLAIFLGGMGWSGLIFQALQGAVDPRLASLVSALVFLLVNLGIAWLLYWKRIFIKL